MKLVIVLSVIACSVADKLDRTYLPPANAATAGGSPGSLIAPAGGQAGSNGFRPQSAPTGFGRPSTGGFGQPTGSAGLTGLTGFPGSGSAGPISQSGPYPSGPARPNQPSANFRQPSGFNQPTNVPSAGQFGQATGSSAYNTQGAGRPFGSAQSFDQSQAAVGQPSSFGAQGNQGSQGPTRFGTQGSVGFGGLGSYTAGAQGSAGFSGQGPAGAEFGAQGPAVAQSATGFGTQGPARLGAGGPAGFGPQGTAGFSAQPQQPERAQAAADKTAEILRYENENDGETFSYSFETSNGIAVEESGVATNGVQAQGAFRYIGDDGQQYSITYTADENGYVPRGDHLPTPPPIPESIQRAIEKNAAAAAAGTQEGAYRPEEYEDGSSNGPQQYNAGGVTAFDQSQGKSPSKKYGSSNSGFGPSRGGSPNQGSGFGQSAQSNLNQASGYGRGPQSTQGSSFGQNGSPQDSGFGQGARPIQGSAFTQSAQGFNQPQRPSASGGQNRPQTQQPQGDNGYEYNRPSQFGSNQGSGVRPQFGVQNGPQQYNRPQVGSAFARPNTAAPRPQSSFGGAPSGNQLGSAPSSAQGSYNSPVGPQGSYNAPSIPKGSLNAPVSGQAGDQAAGSIGRPGAGSDVQQGYNYPAGSSLNANPSRPGFGGAGAGPMGDQTNQYAPPRSQSARPGAQGFNKPTSGFGAPRQPPSFSPEEGYKY